MISFLFFSFCSFLNFVFFVFFHFLVFNLLAARIYLFNCFLRCEVFDISGSLVYLIGIHFLGYKFLRIMRKIAIFTKICTHQMKIIKIGIKAKEIKVLKYNTQEDKYILVKSDSVRDRWQYMDRMTKDESGRQKEKQRDNKH